MTRTAPAPKPTLSSGAAANLAWFRRIEDHHRKTAEAGERHEREGRARHPDRSAASFA